MLRIPVAMVLAALLLTAVASPAQANRREQARYAKETINLSADAFLARKADFMGQGCRVGPGGCAKPYPYNEFDWTDDGCSIPVRYHPISATLRGLFDGPCKQHDFGYRNYGKGLTLGRSERNRAYIDKRFRAEMYAICNRSYVRGRARSTCKGAAFSMWGTVRHASSWEGGNGGW